MARKTFEWDYAAAGELLLRSAEITEFCEKEAERMTRATGMSYEPNVYMGKNRVRVGSYDKSGTAQYPVCPACGRSHPNCNCD